METSEDLSMDEFPIVELHSDVLLQVFQHLDFKSLLNAGSVCKLWQQLSSSQAVWKKQWQGQYGIRGQSRMSSNHMGGAAVLTSSDPVHLAEDAARLLGIHPCSDWRLLFKRCHEVSANWAHGHSSAHHLHGHSDFIRCAQLEGNTLVTASGSISHLDCTIRVWDTDTGGCRHVLRGHMGPIWCMMYEPSTQRIASGSDDYTVRVWDAVNGNCVVLQDPDSAVRCIHMDQESRTMVAGTEFGKLLLWDMNQLDEIMAAGVEHVREEFAKCQPSVRSMDEMQARRVVVEGTGHAQLQECPDQGKAMSAVQVQAGLCASTSDEPLSRIQLWDVSSGRWKHRCTLGDASMLAANSLSFETSLARLVAGCGDKIVRVWDMETTQPLHLLRGHTEDIHAHQFDARMVASAAEDGQVRTWDMRSGKCSYVLEHSGPVHALRFNENYLASGTWDGRVVLWDLRQGSLVEEWEQHNERVWAVAMDQYQLVSASLDRSICVRSFLPTEVRFSGWKDAQEAV